MSLHKHKQTQLTLQETRRTRLNLFNAFVYNDSSSRG